MDLCVTVRYLTSYHASFAAECDMHEDSVLCKLLE